ncbi:MAG: nickel insertion protein [Rhabdochlamydiaceae bacterium]
MPRSVRKKPNRVLIKEKRSSFEKDKVAVVETNIDDTTGEIIGNAVERLLDGGAYDATVSAFLGKKGRAGHTVRVTCDPRSVERFAKILVEETGTLGVKTAEFTRFIVPRRNRSIPVKIGNFTGSVDVKIAQVDGVLRIKPEFSEAKKIADSQDMPLRVVLEMVSAEAQKIFRSQIH